MSNQSLGKLGEDLAVKFLQKKGFKIIAQNYRSKRWGELDVVCLDENVLVFVEVKTRTSYAFGSPADAVTEFKLKKLVRSAQYFKLCHPETPPGMRLDVIGILLDDDTNEILDLQYYKSVYEAS